MKWNARFWRVGGGVFLSGLLALATPTRSPVPGTLNYLEGQATVNGTLVNSSSIGNEVLQPGEVLGTQNGKVEMLLTPGVFLRLGENSEARMVSNGLANVEIALDRGQATVEADWWTKDNRLTIDQTGARTDILKKGLYVVNSGQPFAQVLDGKAKVTLDDQSVNVGKNHEAILNESGKLKAQDFNSKPVKETALLRWSSLRSGYEAQANLDAARTVVVNNGWYGPGWYWGPSFGYWSFLPADGFFYNPFGWGFYSPFYVYGGGPYVIGRPGFYGRGFYGSRGGAVFVGPRGGGFVGSARGFSGGGGFHGGGRR
ncbi:MAG: hypothetical protein JO307_00680 [Bryobacterales bacterium]|nr:hypothetical protein [Bryobacterales bacterium]MBV9396777.1 hypothetical protein [Bryobacterales bacterium]